MDFELDTELAIEAIAETFHLDPSEPDEWHLDRFGPTPHAFTFKLRFPVPGADAAPIDMQPDPWCMGQA